MSGSFIKDAVMILVPMILSLTVHEYSHALAARLLGDDTAEQLGRLSLSPLPHIDILGTIILPLISIGSGMPFLGWAKPVPTNPNNYTRKITRKTGYMLVSIAGPISNFLFGILAITILKILILVQGFSISPISIQILQIFIFMNIGLGFFNFLPIPPLDGSKILQWLLPDEIAMKLEQNSMIFFGILIVLVFTGGINYFVKPIFWMIKFLFQLYNIPIA